MTSNHHDNTIVSEAEMPSQSLAADFEVAELEKEVPKQLEVEKPLPEAPDSKENDQTATKPEPLPTSHGTVTNDYSDAPSRASDNSGKARRKHQRGGRKQRQLDAQALEEAERERFEEQEGRGKQPLPEIKHRKSNSKMDTGLKAFNIRRGSSSGRPFGITVEGGDSDSKKVKSKVKPKNKSKRKVRCDKCGRKGKKASSEEHWENDSASEETEQEEQKTEEELPKQKPFAIRLDLNLDIEIFLRAKIKGDVTITFLQ